MNELLVLIGVISLQSKFTFTVSPEKYDIILS